MSSQFGPWDAFKEMAMSQQAMNRLCEEGFPFQRGPWSGVARSGDRVCQLPVDAYATDDAVIIIASLPGADKDSVDITLDDNKLTIRAQIKAEEQHKYFIRERMCGTFVRTLELNVPVQADKISAEFKQGVLTLTLPKMEGAKPRKINVRAV